MVEKIVNVKTPLKGQHLLEPYQQLITLSPDNETCEFLHKILSCVVPARISSQSNRHCWRSPLPHALALFQRNFGCVLGVQQTKQLPHVAKVVLVWQLGMQSGSIVEQPWTTCFLSVKDPESEPAREAIQSGV
ncbi:hypothetical protein TNCV_1719271 [Trichonephila clavipes]|nr:hypothetical protein TNCV_1719271 [Trichonephila clavipes]